MTDPKLRVLISAEQIQARIRELGEKISADYPTGNLHMICILKGAVFFMTDLARAMKRDVQLDFMGISTYGKGKTSSGEVKVTKDLDISLEGAAPAYPSARQCVWSAVCADPAGASGSSASPRYPQCLPPVSYTHLTLPTNREV